MWLPKGNTEKKAGNGLVAVAIDRDKGSQHALRWAIDNLLSKGQTVVLIHVVQRATVSSSPSSAYICDFSNEDVSSHKYQLEKQSKDLFLTFHCFCTRKDVQTLDIILEDTDIVKAITEYVSYAAIQNLVLGAASRHGFMRFRTSSVPGSVSKGVPDFCTVYVISKGKISSVRNASRAAPFISPLVERIHKKHNQNNNSSNNNNEEEEPARVSFTMRGVPDKQSLRPPQNAADDLVKSPYDRGGRGLYAKVNWELSESDTDISFVSSGRPSTDRSSYSYEYMDPVQRLSTSSDHSLGLALHDFSSTSSQNTDDVENEMRRLQLELKQTMEMYSVACKEALTAKQKATELHRWRMEEEHKVEEARQAQEAALSMAEKEKARCRTALEEAEAAKRLAELEAQRGAAGGNEIPKGSDDLRKMYTPQLRYRKYSIDEIETATDYFTESRKIGEGGYGPVFKCYLDHTRVAVKVLRPDANQGRLQFQQEIEILSCIRHPNIVLLLGACPDYGCLVYEYMAKGSLEDRLFRRGNTPVIPWQYRFRIAAEIATGLLFLHQTRPEPIVHRDLKPANILLDSNYVAKISDVGLARLVPALAENVTQCRMTSAAGTFCYIDPEYQQTGMLGVKSDVYSYGILLLQLLTAKPAMGLTHHIEDAIDSGTFAEMLDPAVPDWPVEDTLCLAKIALQCAELRRKDRPDLSKVVMPELIRLRDLAEDNMDGIILTRGTVPSPNHSQTSFTQETMSETSASSFSAGQTGEP